MYGSVAVPLWTGERCLRVIFLTIFVFLRLERLLGAVATCSPVLSNAEQNMAQELRSIHDQLHATSRLLDKVGVYHQHCSLSCSIIC